ncbi:MAG: tetratricopeptide repeat protein, partial [Bifidobacteriaceae bacterium]|nr:tetratricopeptide repeat protein [Bifidobacteriaceae bacterium]
MSAPAPAPRPQRVVDNNKRVLDDLKIAAKAKELVPFVGAGMSHGIFPLWQTALTRLIDARLTWDDRTKDTVRGLVEESKFEEAASELAGTNRHRLTHDLYQEFRNVRITAERLATMPVSLLPRLATDLVVTTNFDRVIEWVYQGRLEPVLPPFSDTRPAQTRAVVGGDTGYLVKIHGCISRECDLVFTKDDYNQAYGKDFDGAGAGYLRRLLEVRRMFFLGCGLRKDRTLGLAEYIAQGCSGAHFAVLEAPKDPCSNDFGAWWDRLDRAGISCYWYPHATHTRVEEILRYLLSPDDHEPPADNEPPSDDEPPGGAKGGTPTASSPASEMETAVKDAHLASPVALAPGGDERPGSLDATTPTADSETRAEPSPDARTPLMRRVVVRTALKEPAPPGATPPSVALPPGPTTVIGRPRELERLKQALTLGRAAALVGTGGIGKTTLAQEYVRANKDKYSWVWWLDASTEGSLSGSLADEGRKAMSASGAAGVTLVTDAAAEVYARHLLRDRSDWLVVLDGAPGTAEVDREMAAMPSGAFLVTTREDQDWQNIGVTRIKVDVLSKDDAVRLLTARARPPSMAGWEASGDAGDLVYLLGYLPLAVTQVGALLHLEGATSPSPMLAQWRKNPAAQLHAAIPDTPSKRTMAHVWDLSIAHLEHSDPSAAQLLSILGWLGPPEGIPRSLLSVLPADAFPDGPAKPLRAAASASLLTMRADIIAIHPVLHLVLRTRDKSVPQRTPDRIDAARAAAATMLRETLDEDDPSDPAAWPTIRSLVESAEILITEDASGRDEDTSYVVREVGQFLSEQGSYQRAVALFEWNLRRAERALAPDDPGILTARSDLAKALVDRRGPGELDRAICLFESVLKDRELAPDPDHRDILAARHSLAVTLVKRGSQSDLNTAIALLRTVLEDRERTLPANDPDILYARHDLAWALVTRREKGDRNQAVELSRAALADCERILGADHHRTLSIRHTLAWALKERREPGDPNMSISLYRSVLSDKERILGINHPRTLSARHHLGQALVDRRGQGDLERAIDLYEKVLADRERIVGIYHPRTLSTRHDLAWALKERGGPEDLANAIT